VSRRSFLVGLGVFALLLSTILGVAWLLLRHEPHFYADKLVIADAERARVSHEFVSEFIAFGNSLSNEREWYGRFTDRQVNCFFADGIFRVPALELPEGVSEPRVQFEPERIRLAFRYKSGLINTVVSASLRLWLPAAERNTLALQLESFKAGLMPMSAQWLLEQVSEGARRNSIEVTWYRHEGMPVALLRFQADRARPTMQLNAVQIEDGSITIKGRTVDPMALGRK
jgi:hypothetical protein